jgi:hypothetical protein
MGRPSDETIHAHGKQWLRGRTQESG